MSQAKRVYNLAKTTGQTIAQAYNKCYGHFKGVEKIDGMRFYHCPDGSKIGTRRMPRVHLDCPVHPIRQPSDYTRTLLDIWVQD